MDQQQTTKKGRKRKRERKMSWRTSVEERNSGNTVCLALRDKMSISLSTRVNLEVLAPQARKMSRCSSLLLPSDSFCACRCYRTNRATSHAVAPIVDCLTIDPFENTSVWEMIGGVCYALLVCALSRSFFPVRRWRRRSELRGGPRGVRGAYEGWRVRRLVTFSYDCWVSPQGRVPIACRLLPVTASS